MEVPFEVNISDENTELFFFMDDLRPDNIQHVVPLNDLEDHLVECWPMPFGNPRCDCKCKPKHEVVGEGMIVIHNSFDGREGVEWANEILK